MTHVKKVTSKLKCIKLRDCINLNKLNINIEIVESANEREREKEKVRRKSKKAFIVINSI